MACQDFDNYKNLIRHQDSKVRFYMTDPYLLCASNPEDISSLLLLLEDNNEIIRWKAIDTISRLSTEQITTWIYFYENKPFYWQYKEGMNLLNMDNTMLTLKKHFALKEKLLNTFALIYCLRSNFSESKTQELAAECSNEDVSNFFN